ncbi:O-antigen ligase family protein [Microbacterium sp. NPDC056052]|uniref:O-antigen ligase family protein n=1 Tax=Microbacterium sp. NPDC056052 TaxID=3345695 RepID=UPI0035D64B7B
MSAAVIADRDVITTVWRAGGLRMTITAHDRHGREATRSVENPANPRSARRKNPSGRRRERLQLAVIAIALLCYTTLGWAVSLFQTGRVPPTTLTTASVELTSLGTTLRNSGPYLVYAVAGVIVLSNITRMGKRPLRGLLLPLLGALLLWVTMSVSTGQLTSGLRFSVLIAIIAVTVWSIGLETDDLVVIGRIGFVIALISLVMALTTDKAWTDETIDSKALIGNAVLAGFFPQMNPLGMSMAITLPFTLMFKRRLSRFLGFAATATTLLLASSRTALIAAGIALLAGIILRAVPRNNRIFFGAAMLLTIFVVSVVVPLTSDAEAFTNRGAIWRASITLFPERPIWGYGPNVFGLDGAVSRLVLGAYWHGHNVVITFAMVGGVVALIALLVFLLSAIHPALKSAKVDSLIPFMLTATILALAITEVPVRPSEFDGVAWVSWLCLFSVATLAPKKKTDEVLSSESDHSR